MTLQRVFDLTDYLGRLFDCDGCRNGVGCGGEAGGVGCTCWLGVGGWGMGGKTF